MADVNVDMDMAPEYFKQMKELDFVDAVSYNGFTARGGRG